MIPPQQIMNKPTIINNTHYSQPNLVQRATDGRTAGHVRATGPGTVGELRRARDGVDLSRRLFSPYPPDQRDGGRGFRLRQQRRSDKVLKLLREIRVTQEYVGPKRTSMFRVDHHRTPVSRHNISLDAGAHAGAHAQSE